jgi:hypothetical protein
MLSKRVLRELLPNVRRFVAAGVSLAGKITATTGSKAAVSLMELSGRERELILNTFADDNLTDPFAYRAQVGRTAGMSFYLEWSEGTDRLCGRGKPTMQKDTLGRPTALRSDACTV